MAIANKTTNYGLPLPVGGEVMAYQDFINEPMQIIDTQMKNNADGVAANAQGLTQANQNISAADSKITAIQENLTEWNVPGIITKQQSMDTRLEAVEETTMEFVHPNVGLIITTTSHGIRGTIRSGGLLFFGVLPVDAGTSTTAFTAPLDLLTGTVLNNRYGYLIGSTPGNVFGLKNINKGYVTLSTLITYGSGQNNIASYSPLIFMYNGSETLWYLNTADNVPAPDGYNVMCTLPIPLGLGN